MEIGAKKKIGIGAAQFGLNYGVSNVHGQVAAAEVGAILDAASQSDISFIDTAPGYGCSETVLGNHIDKLKSFSVITKTISIKEEVIHLDHIKKIEDQFELSLRNLNCKQIYSLMVHNIDDLLNKGGDRLFDKLQTWKHEGKIQKIGVSVYERHEIDAVISKYPIDLIQIPINVFDQRLYLDGTLNQLAKTGVEIHARSVFLQGLLLMDEFKLPAYFAPIKSNLIAYHKKLQELNISPLAAALSFVIGLQEISTAIIGIESAKQLKECLKQPFINCSELVEFKLNDFVDPRKWVLS